MGRLPLLMWFFYLSSMVLYIKWRNDITAERLVIPAKAGIQKLHQFSHESHWIPGQARNDKKIFLYLLSLLCAILAMKTKENAFSLPLSIALYEFLFLKGPNRKRLLYLVPFMLTLLIIPLSLLSFDKPVGEVIGSIESASRHYTATTRMSYLFTQFRVLVTYIRLLFLPINQNFDYDYPVYNSFFAHQVLLSFLFLLSIFSFGVYLLYRSHKRGSPSLRLLSWGVFWFFVTLSVESSIFPIPMLISEYRLYAPSMGVFLTVIAALFISGRQRLIIPALIVVTLALSAAAYARNNVWGSNISLWEDAVKKSPNKAGAHNNLGLAYDSSGLTDQAISHYMIAIRLKPDYVLAYNNLGFAYASKGSSDTAVEYFKAAIKLNPLFIDAHSNLAFVYLEKGLIVKARQEFEMVLLLKPDDRKARYFLDLYK